MERHPPDQIRQLVERSFLAFHRRHRAADAARRADALAEALRVDGWEESAPVPPPLKRRYHELKKLRAEASTTERTWDELEEKVQFLREIGYLGEDNSFNAGARVLRHIQIQEIFATELFLQGVFEDLSPPVLFGVLCGMCQELPRAAHTAAGREYRGLGRQIEQIRSSDIVNQAERLTRIPTVWDPQMIIFGRWWAEGRSLGELMLNLHSSSDVSGDLVGAFRRARELAAQLRAVWNTMDRGRADAISALIREVSRGEVEVLD